MYKYNIYGFNVLSEIILNCYVAEFEKEDIRIELDYSLKGFDNTYYHIEVENNKYILNMAYGGLFEVIDGKEIKVCPYEDAPKRAIEMFLLNQCFAAILIQKQNFPLHGAFVAKDEIGISIIGDPGAGKSTLSAGLMKKGWKMVTDDIIRFVFDNDKPYGIPSFPSQKIWKSTAEKLDIDISSCDNIFYRLEKFFYEDYDSFINEKMQMKYIFEIVKSDTNEVKIRKMSKGKMLPVLIKNTYRYHLVDQSNLLKEHLNFMAKLSSNVQGYVIERPDGDFTINEQIKLIEDLIEVG